MGDALPHWLKKFKSTYFNSALTIKMNDVRALFSLLGAVFADFDQSVDHMIKRVEVIVENYQLPHFTFKDLLGDFG